MVGVPGLSKGCITCKRRKVKCDEGKPHCRRCSTASKTCEGYATDRVFINQVGRFRYDKAEALASVLRADNASSLIMRDSLGPAFQGHPSSSATIQCLSMEAFQINIFVSFTTSRLFPLNPVFQPPLPAQCWVLKAIETDSTSVIYYATCCLSAVFFARVHGLSDRILRDGAIFYCKALRCLNENLQDLNLCRDPVNVAASFLLGMYEVSVFDEYNGWIRHAGGVGRLIEMHGANYFRQKLARGYLIVSRILIISEALILRRACFLDRESWRTIPWMDDPRSKTSLDAIIELMACIPRLREESDLLQSMQTHVLAVSAHEFRQRLINFMAELFLWRWRYEQSHPGMAFEVSSEATGRNKDSPLRTTFYPTVFFFKDFDTGREPLLYNTALLMIFALAATWQLADPATQAMAKLPQQEHPLQCTNPLSLPHAGLRIEEILHENCRSFEFFLQGPHAAAGAMVLLLPLRFTYIYSKEERQIAWLSQLMKRISGTCGFGIFDKMTDHNFITID